MSGNTKRVASVTVGMLLSACASFPVFAAADIPLNAADRAEVVRTLVTQINANYIDPGVAKRVAGAVDSKNAEGGYASAASAQAFSDALATDLRKFSGDLHFGARLDDSGGERSRIAPDDLSVQVVRSGYGIEKVERLPGNVGYIELRDFGPTELVGPAYTAALSLLEGADALILDLRRNGGGSPESVAYLMSHFFPPGDKRHLIDIYNRPSNTTREIWTVPTVALHYRKPVYVLTSARTFSGGEDCAYDFQVQKRATLVGETTGGGANPVRRFSVGHGILVAIPTGRATNFVTKTSWEHVGVKPDIAVPAAQALQTAHVAILRTLVPAARDDDERTKLQHALVMAEKGDADPPIYTLRGER